MNPILMLADSTSTIDVTGLTSALQISAFMQVIQDLLPIVAVACLVGFVIYVVRWAIGLFRGV